MNRKLLILTLFIFGLVLVAVVARRGVGEAGLKKQNENLVKKELKLYKLNDLGIELLSPGELIKHDLKIKKVEIIKQGIMYDYSEGAFRISVARFEYAKDNPDIDVIENALLLQFKNVSNKETLKYQKKDLDEGGVKARVIYGTMGYKKLKLPVGFFAKIITKDKYFYQFIITYVDTGEDIKEYSKKIFESIKLVNE
ncbi:hypothetical protein DEFDS_0981 [Deferribacter desulfuricans SSM1]|uniref:Uncharacterized protein n=1 Tax=Deferribacter desulfuricans (strain DSM 14783 / JCM 11476 / NBRC 101012 / SSM1) TaxID=639282 RepID=D3PCY0_DEFDS|nr:hypothetical protein [Deferribacter desulfuricans]BAI80453.1 hypothetical protein DEFDS_0981 [Deferribacter desulfuricans SSM1]